MKTIGISARSVSLGLRRTLNALGEVMNVCFKERTVKNGSGVDAWIYTEAGKDDLYRIAHSDRPCYAVIPYDQRISCRNSSLIQFSSHTTLPPVLRGRQIKADETAEMKSLPHYIENMAVIASKEKSPVWAAQEVHGQYHYYVSSSIPELDYNESLFQYFHGNQFFNLLPFYIFLRALTEDQRWEQPPLQACFMFDDPNLHWRTYGFIDFAQIAEHALAYNYHTCFATIPLDTWFVHKPTALLFQKYQNQLSLLIHGNDHIALELARPYLDEEPNRNLRQALRRIETFERRTGVEVSDTMAPPHGACTESTLGEMANLGFDAACISKGSLRHHNRYATWIRTLGMKPADIIAGLTVFPRFPLSSSCHNSILIASLLHQPIISVGHHTDLADGLQLLEELAGFTNSLGTVHWASMKRICRSHYARKVDGAILQVRMFTRCIEVCVPDGINKIWVEQPLLSGEESMSLKWRCLSVMSAWNSLSADEPIPVLSGQKIEILSKPLNDSLTGTKKERSLYPWPVVRRQITEARDRIAPIVGRVTAFFANPNKT